MQGLSNVRLMPKVEWEQAQVELADIINALRTERLSKLVATTEYCAHSLVELSNPVQAGIGLSQLAERLVREPDLRHRVEALSAILLQFPRVASEA